MNMHFKCPTSHGTLISTIKYITFPRDCTGSSKKMNGIWNRYNLKSTRRIYTFSVLKCSEKFKVLDLPLYISICATFVALETSKRNSISCHLFWIMSCVTVSMADVILSCRCWIFLIFSAYTTFLMYTQRKKSSGKRSGLRGGQGEELRLA